METLSYCQLMERCLAAEARVVELEQRIATQREYYDGVIADGGKRIAKLESRTVKLPKAMSIEGGAYCSAHTHYDSDGDYYDRTDVEEMLTAYGIKWEVE